MAKGRCAGCGMIDQSSRVIDRHVVSCRKYLELYKQDSSKALDPQAEFIRWNAEENSAEERAEAKDIRLSKRFADLDQKRTVQSARWQKPKDPLDD